MDPTTPAIIAATTLAVATCIDKLIELWLPNSKINSMFDVVYVFITKLASAFTDEPLKK